MSESTSPVLALRYNILSAFEKANESFQARLQAAVEQGRLSPEIELDEQPGIPVAPKISRESRDSASEIWLQVTYRPLEAVPSCQVRFRRIVRLRRQSSDDRNRCKTVAHQTKMNPRTLRRSPHLRAAAVCLP